jgi:hypothetical protein
VQGVSRRRAVSPNLDRGRGGMEPSRLKQEVDKYKAEVLL